MAGLPIPKVLHPYVLFQEQLVELELASKVTDDAVYEREDYIHDSDCDHK